MPVLGSNMCPIAINKRHAVVRPQEIRDCIPIASLPVNGNHAVEARLELLLRQKTQGVANVDDGAVAARRHPLPLLRVRRHHLQAPLVGEEDSDAANVGVLVVADGFGLLCGRHVWVA